jgi:chloramphenicol O-acetyltransferase
MKKFFLAVFFSFVSLSLFAQEDRFRIDYDMVCVWDEQTNSWSKWKSGNNTFVFNINNNKDITHYKADGSSAHYRKLSNGVEKGTTNDGYQYQMILVLDEDGTKCKLQLFDDTSIGLKLMYSNVMLQFAKSE